MQLSDAFIISKFPLLSETFIVNQTVDLIDRRYKSISTPSAAVRITQPNRTAHPSNVTTITQVQRPAGGELQLLAGYKKGRNSASLNCAGAVA